MTRHLSLAVCVLLSVSVTAAAQDARAVVTEVTPIYLMPDTSRMPLRTAAVNTQLRVRADEGEWLRVEFQDPQFGQRTGYVQSKHVRVSRPDLEPMDLSIPEAPARGAADRVDSYAEQHDRGFGGRGSDMEVVDRHSREGFWFNGGLGFGSLGCENCLGRANGVSGGLSLGRTIGPRLLLGLGTTGWARADSDLTVGTFDARLRFYPSEASGFFITGGMGLGTLTTRGYTEVGVGVILGLGYDIRVSRNVSLTPFWNGFAMRSSVVDANVGQLGLGITIH